MIAKVQKWGNSLGIRLPKGLAKDLQISAGTSVDLRQKGDEIILKPLRRRKYTLKELLAGVTPENTHDEVDFGPPVGKELL